VKPHPLGHVMWLN